jgi:hypothetical protein
VGNDSWSALVTILSVAMMAGLITLVIFGLLAHNQAGASTTAQPLAHPRSSAASLAKGVGYLYGTLGRAPRARSVGDSLYRATHRIDAIDPYARSRRIGEALSRAGLHRNQDPSDTHQDVGAEYTETGDAATHQDTDTHLDTDTHQDAGTDEARLDAWPPATRRDGPERLENTE